MLDKVLDIIYFLVPMFHTSEAVCCVIDDRVSFCGFVDEIDVDIEEGLYPCMCTYLTWLGFGITTYMKVKTEYLDMMGK